MKFVLHRVSIWVNIQKKFQVPRSHSIGEKFDANLKNFKVVYLGECATLNVCKLSSHFSRKLCDRGT